MDTPKKTSQATLPKALYEVGDTLIRDRQKVVVIGKALEHVPGSGETEKGRSGEKKFKAWQYLIQPSGPFWMISACGWVDQGELMTVEAFKKELDS